MRTLADAFNHGADNFLLLRLIAAALVIYGHSYGFVGKANHGDFVVRLGWGQGVYTGSLAVDAFFAISGFLVTGSYVNRSNLEAFLKSRALRILPAYAACIALSAYALGAAFTEYPLSDYWRASETFQYVYINLQLGTQLIWNLPGVFTHNFMPDTVNGSIWTLPAEVRMYAWVAILGAMGVLRRRWLANLVFGVILLVGLVRPDQLPLVPHPSYVGMAGMFLAGSFCFINRDLIPLSIPLLAALVLLPVALHGTALFPCALGIAVTYLCLWFAYVPNFHFFNRFGDYSYGIYLWGFPVQQAVSALMGTPTKAWINALVSFVIAGLIAMASWHWVEKPALRLKGRW